MDELEMLRQKAISYYGEYEGLRNDTDKVRLKRAIKWYEKIQKLNDKERNEEYLKVMKACDEIVGNI